MCGCLAQLFASGGWDPLRCSTVSGLWLDACVGEPSRSPIQQGKGMYAPRSSHALGCPSLLRRCCTMSTSSINSKVLGLPGNCDLDVDPSKSVAHRVGVGSSSYTAASSISYFRLLLAASSP